MIIIVEGIISWPIGREIKNAARLGENEGNEIKRLNRSRTTNQVKINI